MSEVLDGTQADAACGFGVNMVSRCRELGQLSSKVMCDMLRGAEAMH